MTLEEKEKAIIEHYRVMPQLKYFQSEVFELGEAIINHEWLKEKGLENIEHITEEVADVQLMMNQFKRFYGISDEDIKRVMEQKADRQLERIKNGK